MFPFTIRDVLLLQVFVAYPCLMFATADNSDDKIHSYYALIVALVAWAVTFLVIKSRRKMPPTCDSADSNQHTTHDT